MDLMIDPNLQNQILRPNDLHRLLAGELELVEVALEAEVVKESQVEGIELVWEMQA